MNGNGNQVWQLCDTCFPKAESFCQMYDLWCCLQLEMDRCIGEISSLIQMNEIITKDAEVYDSDRVASEKTDYFRKAFLSKGKFAETLNSE